MANTAAPERNGRAEFKKTTKASVIHLWFPAMKWYVYKRERERKWSIDIILYYQTGLSIFLGLLNQKHLVFSRNLMKTQMLKILYKLTHYHCATQSQR